MGSPARGRAATHAMPGTEAEREEHGARPRMDRVLPRPGRGGRHPEREQRGAAETDGERAPPPRARERDHARQCHERGIRALPERRAAAGPPGADVRVGRPHHAGDRVWQQPHERREAHARADRRRARPAARELPAAGDPVEDDRDELASAGRPVLVAAVEDRRQDLQPALAPVGRGIGEQREAVGAFRGCHARLGLRHRAPRLHDAGGGPQASGLGRHRRLARAGQAMGPARTPVHDLLPLIGHEPLLAQPVEHAVERAGSDLEPAVRQLGCALDDAVAVQRAVEQRGECEVGRLRSCRRLYISSTDISRRSGATAVRTGCPSAADAAAADHAHQRDQREHVRQVNTSDAFTCSSSAGRRRAPREAEQERRHEQAPRPPVAEDQRRQRDEPAARGHVLVELRAEAEREERAGHAGQHARERRPRSGSRKTGMPTVSAARGCSPTARSRRPQAVRKRKNQLATTSTSTT